MKKFLVLPFFVFGLLMTSETIVKSRQLEDKLQQYSLQGTNQRNEHIDTNQFLSSSNGVDEKGNGEGKFHRRDTETILYGDPSLYINDAHTLVTNMGTPYLPSKDDYQRRSHHMVLIQP